MIHTEGFVTIRESWNWTPQPIEETCCLKINHTHRGRNLAAIRHSKPVKNVKLIWQGTWRQELLSLQVHQDTRHIKACVKGGMMLFVASTFPVFFITFMFLPLPVFMDSSGDVAVSISLLFFSFVSVQSHGRNRKRGTFCKEIKLFSESQLWQKESKVGTLQKCAHIVTVIRYLCCYCVAIVYSIHHWIATLVWDSICNCKLCECPYSYKVILVAQNLAKIQGWGNLKCPVCAVRDKRPAGHGADLLSGCGVSQAPTQTYSLSLSLWKKQSQLPLSSGHKARPKAGDRLTGSPALISLLQRRMMTSTMSLSSPLLEELGLSSILPREGWNIKDAVACHLGLLPMFKTPVPD